MTWLNVFRLGAQTVKVFAGGSGGWDWTGSLAVGGSQTFADPLNGDGTDYTITVSVDANGVLSLSTDFPTPAASAREYVVVIVVPSSIIGARISDVVTDASNALSNWDNVNGDAGVAPLTATSIGSPWSPNPFEFSPLPTADFGVDVYWEAL